VLLRLGGNSFVPETEHEVNNRTKIIMILYFNQSMEITLLNKNNYVGRLYLETDWLHLDPLTWADHNFH